MRLKWVDRKTAGWTSCSIRPSQPEKSLSRRQSQMRPAITDTTCPVSVQRKAEIQSLQWTRRRFQRLQLARPKWSPYLSLRILLRQRLRRQWSRAIQVRNPLLLSPRHSKFIEYRAEG